MADPLQDMQKQRLLQPESPRPSDSPRASPPLRPNHLQPLANYSPRHMQLPQQPQLEQKQLPQQVDHSSQWQWQPHESSPSQPQAFEIVSQQPAVNQFTQNGPASSQQSVARPRSASFVEDLASESQSQTSQSVDTSSRPRTATTTASPRATNEQQAFVTIRAKNVSWQVQLLLLTFC